MALLASLTTGVLAASAAPAPVAGFVDETVITGLTLPTDLEFAADGTVFVAEQDGLVRRFASIGAAGTTYADLRDEVLTQGGRGLSGLAVSPSYPSTPTVWALYTLDQALGGGTVPAFADTCTGPCASRARITRLTGTTTATSQAVVLDGWCQLADKHSVADLEIGADGMLYVSSGDSATYKYADVGQTDDPCGDPVGEGGSLRAQDLRTSGDPVGFEAKVLRIDPSTGAAAAGNPASASSDPNTRRIIADGLRNPWRLALRPGTSELYVADNGWSTTDELNVFDPTKDPVVDFGWPCYEGAAVNTPFSSTPICSGLARSAVRDAAFSYRHDAPQFAGSACAAGTDGTSITGLTFVGTNSYPARLHGALFIGDYARKCISAARPGPDGRPNFGAMEDIVLSADGPVDLETGPGGDVYYLDYVGGTVHRIRWTGPANPAPTPAFTSVTPARVLDTRGSTKPTAGSTRTIQIAGRGGVPTTGAAAVAITLTGTEPDDLAYLTTWPTGTRPNASNLNLTPGQTNANTAIVPLAPDGTIQLYTSGRTHLLVDITAWIPTAT